MTDPSRDLAGLLNELGHRQDRAVERLTAAVAKVLSEAARADAQRQEERIAAMERKLLHAIDGASARLATTDRTARHSDAESLRSELAGLLGALQAGVVERVGHASAAEAEALRSALSSGFNRMGERVAETVRTELARLQVSLLDRLPQAADGNVVDPRTELLAALEEIGNRLSETLERGFGGMRSTLASAAHDSRAAADGVGAIIGNGLGPLRTELATTADDLGQRMRELRAAVKEAAATERSVTEGHVEKLRLQLEESLGSLEEACRGPVDALREPIEKATAAVDAASMARAIEATTIHDEVAAGLAALGDRIDELRRLVDQLWGA